MCGSGALCSSVRSSLPCLCLTLLWCAPTQLLCCAPLHQQPSFSLSRCTNVSLRGQLCCRDSLLNVIEKFAYIMWILFWIKSSQVMTKIASETKCTIVVVGDSRTGKSALLHRFVHKSFQPVRRVLLLLFKYLLTYIFVDNLLEQIVLSMNSP